jgi:hypothetical protein
LDATRRRFNGRFTPHAQVTAIVNETSGEREAAGTITLTPRAK